MGVRQREKQRCNGEWSKLGAFHRQVVSWMKCLISDFEGILCLTILFIFLESSTDKKIFFFGRKSLSRNFHRNT